MILVVFSFWYFVSSIGKTTAYANTKSYNGNDLCPTNEFKSKKAINVLAFDGGGSRGIMEAMIADDLMRIFTLMREDPKKLQPLVMELAKPNGRKDLNKELKSVLPIHPKDVFDMIAGISEKLNHVYFD